jgi:hypothetical protein
MIPKKGEYRQVKENATVKDVGYIMRDLIIELAKNDKLTKECTNELFRISTDYPSFMFNLGNFAYNSAYFVPHPPEKQTIRTINATLRDKSANCVDYTVFCGALAKCAGLNIVIRIVRCPGQKTFGHVYPIINNTPLDITIGQDQTGKEREIRKNGNVAILGVEVPYLEKFDILVP